MEGRALPWGRPHEGISVLCQTTFSFQRAKPIVVSPFENPFPTRGRGPWTPKGGSGQSLVLSHAIDRPRCTDRQLLGVGIPLASYGVLRTTQGSAKVAAVPAWRSLGSLCSLGMTDQARPRGRGVLPGPCHLVTLPHLGIPATHPNCHPDGAAIGGDWRDLQPRISATTENKPPALSPKRDTMPAEPQHRAAGGRCIAAGRWYAKAPPPVPSPPWGPGAAAPGREGVLKG